MQDNNTPRTAASSGETAPENIPTCKLSKSTEIALIGFGLFLVFAVCLSAGYTFGKDLAIQDNYKDCVAEGRSDCQRYPSR